MKYQFKYEIPSLREYCNDELHERINALKAYAPDELQHYDYYSEEERQCHKGHLTQPEWRKQFEHTQVINVTKEIKVQLMKVDIDTFISQIGDGDCFDLLEKKLYVYTKDSIALNLQCLYWTSRLVFECDKMPHEIGLTEENDWLLAIPQYLKKHRGDADIEEREVDALERSFDTEDIRREKISVARRIETKLKNIETGEIITFSTRQMCREYLHLSESGWTRFLKGKTKMNKRFEIL